MDSFDLVVIGAGPGGYVAAIRAAQLGMRVALIEKRKTLGGTCLNVGCIPSKALLESSELYATVEHKLGDHGISVGDGSLAPIDIATLMARKQRIVGSLTDGLVALMKKNRIEVIHGEARLNTPHQIAVRTDDEGADVELAARHTLIATGSAPVELPFMKFEGHHVVSSTEALSFEAVPEHLVVVGGGAVGLELGSVWRRLGARVTVIEMLPHIAPFADVQIARLLDRALKRQGIDIRVNTRVVGAEMTGNTDAGPVRVSIESKGRKGAEATTLACDRVLVSVGRRPYTKGLGLEAIGVVTEPGGKIPVDGDFRTNVAGVYAIGDVIDGPMLAHKAEDEGIAVAERLAGQGGHVNYDAIPNIIYTWPELASVGLTEEQAKARDIPFKTGRAYLKGNARAKTMGEEEGMVKVIAHAETDRLLGVHIVGARASDLIAEAALAAELHASAEDIARSVHAHPTLSEALREAALAVDRRAIHS